MSPEIGIHTERTSRVLSIVYAILLMLIAVSFGIAIPITSRSFYYHHIDVLKMTETTPWSKEQIRGAFDSMMDFIWADAPFGTGDLKWSESGREHFVDCKALFWFDIKVLVVSIAALLLVFLIATQLKVKAKRFKGLAASFWAGITTFILFAVTFVLGAIDFDRAFVFFHSLFFPGKTNWVFDAGADEIILILPEQYFMDCAILAVILIASICVFYMYVGRRKRN